MSFNVRLFGYSGIIQVGQPEAQQFSSGAVFLNEEPCLWSQILACDGSSNVVTSDAITTVPDITQMVCVEVPDGHEIRYEVVQPGLAARVVSSDSRRGSGSFNLAWNPRFRLSILDAAVAAVVPPVSTTCQGFTIPSTAGLVAWIDACVASSFALSVGAVQSAEDQSANAYHFVSGAVGAVYDPTGFNGRPTLDFQDTTTLQSLNFATAALGTGNELTIFAAATLGSDLIAGTHAYGRLISYTAAGALHDYDNAGSFTLNRDASTSHLTFTRDSASTPNVDISYNTKRRIIFTLKSDGTRTLYIDGVGTSVAGPVANFVSPGFLSMGGSKFDTSFFAGNFSELVSEWGVYNVYKDPTAVGLLDTYLKDKWGM